MQVIETVQERMQKPELGQRYLGGDRLIWRPKKKNFQWNLISFWLDEEKGEQEKEEASRMVEALRTGS